MGYLASGFEMINIFRAEDNNTSLCYKPKEVDTFSGYLEDISAVKCTHYGGVINTATQEEQLEGFIYMISVLCTVTAIIAENQAREENVKQ